MLSCHAFFLRYFFPQATFLDYRGGALLHGDLWRAALLREFVAVASGVTVLSGSAEAASLWEWAAWLTLRASAYCTFCGAVVEVGAEGAVAANWAGWVLAIPRRDATQATRTTAEASTKIHAAQTIDDVRLPTLRKTGCGCHERWRIRLVAISAEVLQTGSIVA
jgi:hypothetical protein